MACMIWGATSGIDVVEEDLLFRHVNNSIAGGAGDRSDADRGMPSGPDGPAKVKSRMGRGDSRRSPPRRRSRGRSHGLASLGPGGEPQSC
jgi:hypothetical protein